MCLHPQWICVTCLQCTMLFSHVLGPLLVLHNRCSLVSRVVFGAVTVEKQKHIFMSRGCSKVGQSVMCPLSMSQLRETVVCSLQRSALEETHCFLNCVFMSPLTVSVPWHFTMEAIVCLVEKAWAFCFNHFWKSYVWHGGGLTLPVVEGRLVLCAHFSASPRTFVLSGLCVIFLNAVIHHVLTPVESFLWWGVLDS